MYPIATELGLSEDGKMQYEIFGVRLDSSKGRLKLLRELRIKSLLMRDLPLMKRILTENLRDAIISEDMLSLYSRTHTEPFDWGTVKPKDISGNGISLVSLYNYIDIVQHYGEIREICVSLLEMLKNRERRFLNSQSDLALLRYLNQTQALGLKMYQDTPSRVMRGSSTDLTSIYSNLSIAKSNAIILMLLTGNMNYIDRNGEVKSIVIDGVINGVRSLEEPRQQASRNVASLKYINK